MKNTNIFNAILLTAALNSYIYSMVPLPITTNTMITTQVLNTISCILPSYIQSMPGVCTSKYQPQIHITKEQLETLKTELLQDFKLSSKKSTGFTAPTGGMFHSTRPMLMCWNHQENPTTVLGTSDNPTENELKLAHKKMAMKHHPDRGGKQEDFVKAQDAYEYLMHLLKIGQLHPKSNNASQTNTGYQTDAASQKGFYANKEWHNYSSGDFRSHYRGFKTENDSSSSSHTNHKQTNQSSKDYSFRSTDAYKRSCENAYTSLGISQTFSKIRLTDEFLDAFYLNNRDKF